ncbi:hypothetical protein [Roseateles sp. P5_E4]
MENSNAASRLRALLGRMQAEATNQGVIEGWKSVFQLVTDDGPEGELRAVRHLLDIKLEAEQMSRDLSGRVPAHLTVNATAAFINAISPRLLNQRWELVMQHFPPHVVTTLDFCVHLLPDDQAEIDADLWNDLRTKVDELRAALADEGLPAGLRDLIRFHLELIEDALQACRVRGVIKLQVAFDAAATSLARAEPQLAAYNDVPAFGRLVSMWGTVQKIGDGCLKAEKYAHLALGFKDFVGGVLRLGSGS